MQYTIKDLARLAGISGRTLRYYDQIGLLRPGGRTASGYRLYGPGEVDRLQQVLFYRELGLELRAIQAILDAPSFDTLEALRNHRKQLLRQRERLDALLKTVETTIRSRERSIPMADNDKFQGFKEKLVEENERKYGQEVRKAYSDEVVDASNAKLMNMSREDFADMQKLGEEILEKLDAATALAADPAGPLGNEIAGLHREWLGFTWKNYTPETHLGVAELYVADVRFAAYYNRGASGKVEFLRDAVKAYVAQCQPNQ